MPEQDSWTQGQFVWEKVHDVFTGKDLCEHFGCREGVGDDGLLTFFMDLLSLIQHRSFLAVKWIHDVRATGEAYLLRVPGYIEMKVL